MKKSWKKRSVTWPKLDKPTIPEEANQRSWGAHYIAQVLAALVHCHSYGALQAKSLAEPVGRDRLWVIIRYRQFSNVRYLSQNWWEFIPLQGLCHNDLRASSVLLTSRRFWKWNGELWIMLREGSSIKEFLSAGQGSRRSCSPEWCGSTCCNGHRRLALCHDLCSLNLDQSSRLRSVPFAHVFACPIMSQFEPPHSRIQRWFATQS